MKKHFGCLLWIGASVANVNQRNGMPDTERMVECLVFNIRFGGCQCNPGYVGCWISSGGWVNVSGNMRWVVMNQIMHNCRVLLLSQSSTNGLFVQQGKRASLVLSIYKLLHMIFCLIRSFFDIVRTNSWHTFLLSTNFCLRSFGT